MAAFCLKCGTALDPGVRFCKSCGAAVEAEGEGAAGNGAAPAGVNAASAGTGAGAGFGGANQSGAAQGGSAAQPGGQQQAQQFADKIKQIAQGTPDFTGEMDPADIEKNKTMGCLAYILFFLPFITCPDSKFARFHANQGLIYLIVAVAANIVRTIIKLIFFLPVLNIIAWLASLAIYAALLGMFILGVINANSGKARELPFVGKFRLIK